MAEANPKMKQPSKKAAKAQNSKKQTQNNKKQGENKQTKKGKQTPLPRTQSQPTVQASRKKKQNNYDGKSGPTPNPHAWGRGRSLISSYSDVTKGSGVKQPHTGHYYKLLERRKALPIWSYKNEIIKLIQSSQVVVIEGETGSGKSTQVPQWCLELPGIKQVVCTQPRRIAAISLAQRVAQEMDVRVGQEVGFVVRFEHKAGPKTVLKYVTDGILLRHVIEDRALSRYDVIIIDEVHERRMVTDIVLGVIKDILHYRLDLKVIIMSATMNVNKFCEFFDNCPHLCIPGKLHPIEISYSPAVIPRCVFNNDDKSKFLQFVFDAINVVIEICLMEKTSGDILVFVSGKDEIDYICNKIGDLVAAHRDKMGEIAVIPLYGDLPYNSQQRIFGPSPPSTFGKIGRKCIVSTNIAETSITIDGVVFVIDSGKVKLSSVLGTSHLKSLLPVDISQSSADQRAGRAGRTRPGKCYRLYSKANFDKLEKDTVPEILRCDLTSIILQLKVMGIDIEHFESVDPPTPEAFAQAIMNLKQLNALDSLEAVSSIGVKMSRFPVDADVARMLVASQVYNCQQDIITLAAILSCDRPSNVFMVEKKEKEKAKLCKDKFCHPLGDHITYINVFNIFKSTGHSEAWCRENFINYKLLSESNTIRNQLTSLMCELGLMKTRSILLSGLNDKNITKAILAGSLGNIAHIQKKSKSYKQHYTTQRDKLTVTLHPSSILDPKSSSYPSLFYYSCMQTVPKQFSICIVSILDGVLLSEVMTACKAEQRETFPPSPPSPLSFLSPSQPCLFGGVEDSRLPLIETLSLDDYVIDYTSDDDWN